jgi:hypothetical protein
MTANLDTWLCNLYFDVKHWSRYLDRQVEKEFEMKFHPQIADPDWQPPKLVDKPKGNKDDPKKLNDGKEDSKLGSTLIGDRASSPPPNMTSTAAGMGIGMGGIGGMALGTVAEVSQLDSSMEASRNDRERDDSEHDAKRALNHLQTPSGLRPNRPFPRPSGSAGASRRPSTTQMSTAFGGGGAMNGNGMKADTANDVWEYENLPDHDKPIDVIGRRRESSQPFRELHDVEPPNANTARKKARLLRKYNVIHVYFCLHSH